MTLGKYLLPLGTYLFSLGIYLWALGKYLTVSGKYLFMLGNALLPLGITLTVLGNALFHLGNALFLSGASRKPLVSLTNDFGTAFLSNSRHTNSEIVSSISQLPKLLLSSQATTQIPKK